MRLTKHLLTGDGDFRSPECIEILENADVVVTNPPFSIIDEYLDQLVKHGKKFLFIGPLMMMMRKSAFDLVKAEKMWPGLTWVKEFKTDDGEMQKFGNIVWYTNLDHTKRHEEIVCVEKYSPEKYPAYANYPNAVEVGKVNNIPVNYDGEMGVSISYLMHHCPEQFEIVGASRWLGKKMSEMGWPKDSYISGGIRFYLDESTPTKTWYRCLFDRIVIRRKPAGDEEVQVTELEGDGDFRSPECVKLLDEADVVVTNPPFSLFREYVAQLVEHDKKFLIIGQTNAITYKEIFPLIKDGKMWLGYGFKGGNSYFRIPKDRVGEYDESFCDREKCIVHFRNCSWITNMDHGKRHEFLTLTEKYDSAKYPKYDNYDAINVDKVNNIPKDYDGVMGVPITFLDKYNPEQFEILGTTYNGMCDKTLWIHPEEKHNEPFIKGKKKYVRLLIQKRKSSGENEAVKWPRQEIDGILRPVLNNKHLYRRILIRRRK